MVGGLHTSGYLLVWTTHYLTLNEDVYDKLIEEMKERVGSDQSEKLKNYAYDKDTYVCTITDGYMLYITYLACHNRSKKFEKQASTYIRNYEKLSMYT